MLITNVFFLYIKIDYASIFTLILINFFKYQYSHEGTQFLHKRCKMNHEIINFEWKLSIMDLHESKSTFFFNLIKLNWNGTCISNNAKLHVYCFKVKKNNTLD